MASSKQTQAARHNVKKAQAAAKSQRTLANLPSGTRSDMGKQGAKARARGGAAGRRLEDRTRPQLYDLAREKGIAGRSKMRTGELIDALRAAR